MSRNAFPQIQRDEVEKEDRRMSAREERWKAEADRAWDAIEPTLGTLKNEILMEVAEAAFKRGYMAARFAQ